MQWNINHFVDSDIMMKVERINNGTVIDHIRAGKGKRVLDLLGIGDDYPHLVALVMNVSSRKMGKKDMVKIAGIYVKDELANKVALVSPNATINIIEDSKVIHKHKVVLPEVLEGMGVCPNPMCITNMKNVGDMRTHFVLASKLNRGVRSSEEDEGSDKYVCQYCERVFTADELV